MIANGLVSGAARMLQSRPSPMRAASAVRLAVCLGLMTAWFGSGAASAGELPHIQVAGDGRGFVTATGQPFVPIGVTYFRPGTGWAPQLWKQFDAAATRKDFARLKDMGLNCARVFLSYGSFYSEPGRLSAEGLARFDEFLKIAEAAGIYVQPTGPDHWEGTPEWARGDRFGDDRLLVAQEQFWTDFAARYRGRRVIFAYELLNEPSVAWDTPGMRRKWNDWLSEHYGSMAKLERAWTNAPDAAGIAGFGELAVPPPSDAPGSRRLLDFQHFREQVADEWTRRQAAAIKAADPHALVTGRSRMALR
jgi:beta-galactosidase GanA